MLNVKKTLTKILDALKADYVVEQGTSGIWTYRKWNSGVAECWGVESVTISNYATAFGGYAFSTSANYPAGLFADTPSYFYSARVGNGFALTGTVLGTSKDYANLYAICTNGGSQSTDWHLYVIGKWK